MFLARPYRWSIINHIVLCCVTLINASEYGDINPDFNHQDVLTYEDNKDKHFHNCNNKSTKGNEHIASIPYFKTIVTSKPNGRLGNYLLSYMHLMCVEFSYNVTILTENVVKKSLDTFFKNFNNIQTVDDDACGYYEFFDQFHNSEDNLIIDMFKEKSGINVTMERGPEGITISPVEVAIKYGEEINEVMDSYRKQFLQNYRADGSPECKYEWELFRIPHKALENDEWTTNRALILYPPLYGICPIWDMSHLAIDRYDLENDLLANDNNFQNAFFERLQIKDKFLNNAQKVLHVIRKTHEKRHNLPDKFEAGENNYDGCFTFVGIHVRRTDHLQYERDNDMKNLDLEYYLRAMQLYRKKFARHHLRKLLIFVLLTDDMQWGKSKLLPQAKEGDLYLGGEGLSDVNESIGNDFALLASCNHTIESHGSFSYFAGAFAGGFKIKPNHFQKYREPRFRNTDFWKKSPFNRIPPRLSVF